jgi:pimeloyl-ACP methyl ester carboxylesterase
MQASIRESRLHILPAAGHLLNLEQPELFNQLIQEFLTNI